MILFTSKVHVRYNCLFWTLGDGGEPAEVRIARAFCFGSPSSAPVGSADFEQSATINKYSPRRKAERSDRSDEAEELADLIGGVEAEVGVAQPLTAEQESAVRGWLQPPPVRLQIELFNLAKRLSPLPPDRL
eukprot:488301-Prorocentrum_minimum.AAC.4